jgi:two-component system, response regulator YesN
MYRLLIVDDEAIIADGLEEVFNNLKYLELDVIKAYSGISALGWLNRTRVDIVISDIRMPGMDGLQLLQNIKSNWPHCRVILLSGYSEFDYVYNAIQYDGVSYILKTEGYNKIIKAVENAVEEIEKSIRIDNLISQAREQLDTTSSLIQREYLYCMLRGEMFSAEDDRYKLKKLIQPLNPENPVILLIGHIDMFPKGVSYSERSNLLYSIKLLVEKYLSEIISNVYIYDDYFDMIWMIQPKTVLMSVSQTQEASSQYGRTILFIKGILEIIQAASRESLNLSITFALSDDPCILEQAADKYSFLKRVISYHAGLGREMLLTEKNLGREMFDREMDDSLYEMDAYEAIHSIQPKLKKIDTLATYLELGQEKDFSRLFHEISHCLRKVKSMSYTPACEIYYCLALMFLSHINRWKSTDKIALKMSMKELMRVDEHKSWSDALYYLNKLAGVIFEIQSNAQEERASDTIAFIKQYINDNIQDELSLVRLAEQVYFNPSYLSRLFKQVTGSNISDYVSSVRIKKAKRLLENENLKIRDVAEAVGYISSTNFARFFKAVTNLTPQEYRDAFLTGKQMNKM